MHKTKDGLSKPDLRDTPPISLKHANTRSPVQDIHRENSSDPQRVGSGPDIVKPGGWAVEQTLRD